MFTKKKKNFWFVTWKISDSLTVCISKKNKIEAMDCLTLKPYLGVFWDPGQFDRLISLYSVGFMKHWLPYEWRFLGLKLEKYFGVFRDPKIRLTLVFLRYGSKVKVAQKAGFESLVGPSGNSQIDTISKNLVSWCDLLLLTFLPPLVIHQWSHITEHRYINYIKLTSSHILLSH